MLPINSLIFSFSLLCYGTAFFSSLQKQQQPVAEVVFRAVSRGSSEEIRITPDSVHVQKKGLAGNVQQSRSLSKEEWQQVLESLQGIDFSTIPDLIAPGEKRHRDAAMHGSISVTSGNITYSSNSFDGHSPPRPLVPLMRVMEQLAAKQE